MTKEDLDAVAAIERASFPSPWAKESFEKEMVFPFSRCWVALGGACERDVAGYICVWTLGEEMHVMNLATHPSYRRMGVAKALLHYAMGRAADMGVRQAVLEVRSRNAAARSLYESLGFRVVGIRRGYYVDPGDDAVVMLKEIGPVSGVP